MSNYKGHLVGGGAFFLICLLGLASIPALAVHNIILNALCCLTGALFPDLDTISKGRKYYLKLLPLVLILLVLLNQIYAAGVMVLFTLIALKARHRGIFHRPWFIFISGFLFVGLLSITLHLNNNALAICWIFFIMGAFSHLVFDYGLQR